MQTKTKLKGVKERNYIRQWLGGSVLALAVFVLGFVLVPTLIGEASAFQSVTAGANWVSTSLTFDPDYGNGSISDVGHGNITFGDIIPTSTTENNIGTERVIKKTLGIESTGKYYTVYLSMSGNSNFLKLDGTDSNIKINPVAGTWDTPTAFSATSWGYAVPGTSIPTSSSTWEDEGTPEYPEFSQATTFSDENHTLGYLGTDLTYNSHRTVYNADTWAAVPVFGSAQQIWKAETNNNHGFGGEDGDNTNNHFDIYYGIMVGSDTLAGTYENEIVYTALASMQAIDEISNNLLVSERFVAEDTEQTLKFDLASSASGLIKPSQVYAYVVPHHEAIPNTVAGEQEGETRTETDTEVVARLQGNIASNSAYYDQCTFNRADNSTDIVFDTDGVTITCTMPSKTPVWDGGLTNTGTATDGYFDIWITIPAYNANYISKTTEQGTDTRVASVLYVGLQSVDENGDSIVTEMQEMTGAICKNTNMWNNQTATNARILNHTGNARLINDATEVGGYDSLSARIAAENATIGIGTFALLDNRDENDYLVRRLANGECWMVQNLDLDLSTSGILTPDDTNVSENWDPYGSTNEKINSAYKTKLEDENLPLNFNGLAAWVLGAPEQYSQYQNSQQRGSKLFWGTKRNNEDETVAEVSAKNSSSITTNSFSQIPRSYDNTIYNWTESDGKTIVNGQATRGNLVGIRYVSTNGLTGESELFTDNAENVTTTSSRISAEWDAANNNFYGSEYLGKYYNHYAITAETALDGGYSTGSICPFGWELPKIGSTNSEAKSYKKLIGSTYYRMSNNESLIKTDTVDQESVYSVLAFPMSFMMSGGYSYNGGNIYSRGGSANYKTTYKNGITGAGALYLTSNRIYISYSQNDTFGHSVRCVARD